MITRYSYSCSREGQANTPSTFNVVSNNAFQYNLDIPATINPDNYSIAKIVFANGASTEVPIDGQPHNLITNANKISITAKEDYSALVGNKQLQALGGLLTLTYDLSALQITANFNKDNNQLFLQINSTISNMKITSQNDPGMDSTYISNNPTQQQMVEGNLKNVFDKISITEIFLI